MREFRFSNVCKRLGNSERWAVLRQVVIACDEGSAVSDISGNTRLGVSATSQYLAQLEGECGLVRSERDGRYVLYRFEPDKSNEKAVTLGAALRRHFRGGDGHEIPILPALGNDKRLQVVAALRQKKKATKAELQVMTKMTEINVRRHLAVMLEAGLAEQDGASYSFVEPHDPLAKLFLNLALG